MNKHSPFLNPQRALGYNRTLTSYVDTSLWSRIIVISNLEGVPELDLI